MAQPIPARTRENEGHESGGSSSILQSSLDLVFSYSRSQTFYASNLATRDAPSFAGSYRGEYDDDDERESFADSGRYDEDRRDEDGMDWDETNEDDPTTPHVPVSNEEHEWNEPLPQNASSLHRKPSREASEVANERTPLITSRGRPALRGILLNSGSPSQSQLPYKSPDLSYLGPTPPRLTRTGSSSSSKHKLRKGILPAGSSTFGQTLFNTINVLIGVGILSEPLAFSHAGWIGGSILLIFCGGVTNYTGKLLARIMYSDSSLKNYSDIGLKAFGPNSKTFINILFCLELSALCTAFFVLFGDTLSGLLGSSPTMFKLIGFLLFVPTVFMPLRLLSLTSLVGIFSSFSLLAVVLIDGASKPNAPGSLREPAHTFWSPDWRRIPLSCGLIMSGFSGHAVIPSLARDLDRPEKFDKMLNIAYIVTFAVYGIMGVAGYLMFGRNIRDEITINLLETPGYSAALNKFAVWMIGINPVAKFALGFKPLASTMEHILALDLEDEPRPKRRKSRDEAEEDGLLKPPGAGHSASTSSLRPEEVSGRESSFLTATTEAYDSSFSHYNRHVIVYTARSRMIGRALTKVSLVTLLLAIAIVIPDFDRVMSFLGAFSAFVICVIGPLTAYMTLWKGKLSRTELVIDYLLLLIATILAAVGTVFSFLPH
ncbi:hypothetical protein BT69DRAFT_1258501 [Atractiella rhizophila]|nr:hypothetical protein BT69DRAFT_1258501 [Atractiella rhizophila]